MEKQMRKVVVYGLGERYHLFEEWVYEEIKNEYLIIAVSDKNKYARGNFLNKFIDVKEIVKLDFDAIIITSYKYYEEISIELRDIYGIPEKKLFPMEDIILDIYKRKFLIDLFLDKYGVEIGGPSGIFANNIYKVCNRCDGINYSDNTVWWKNENNKYCYKDKELGDTIILDAVDLLKLEDGKYDFCISSNNLEHIANPIKALEEQKRIVKKDGLILTIVPMKDKCFDHNRDFTEFEHLLDDYAKNVSEDDLTHLNEILDKHDFGMDPACGGKEKFAQRAIKNYENRCLHHHVFNTETLVNMYNYLELSILGSGRLSSNYYIIGRK